MQRIIYVLVTLFAALLVAAGTAYALGSPTPGNYNNWAAHNVISSNYGGWCGKRVSRICLVDHNTAHCGAVVAGSDGFRRCTGTYFEMAPGVKWVCKWRGGIFRANPKRVLTVLPVAPCTKE